MHDKYLFIYGLKINEKKELAKQNHTSRLLNPTLEGVFKMIRWLSSLMDNWPLIFKMNNNNDIFRQIAHRFVYIFKNYNKINVNIWLSIE